MRPRRAAPPPTDADRNREIGAIHAAASSLGMDTADPNPRSDYRSMLNAHGGATSAAALDAAGRRRVLAHLRSCAPKDGWHAGKIRRLWSDLDKAGALDDPSEAGLMRFVARFSQVSALRFLPSRDANKVVEGLKAWLARAKAKAAETGAFR